MEIENICRTCLKINDKDDNYTDVNVKIEVNDDNIIKLHEIVRIITSVEVCNIIVYCYIILFIPIDNLTREFLFIMIFDIFVSFIQKK